MLGTQSQAFMNVSMAQPDLDIRPDHDLPVSSNHHDHYDGKFLTGNNRTVVLISHR